MRVVVIGLGLFGTSVAEAIVREGGDVLAVDKSEQLVQSAIDRGVLSHAACVDALSRTNLERLGVGPDYDVGVIGIGTNLEASVVAAIHLKDLGVKRVVAKALHDTHRKILEKVGADETLIPEVLSGLSAARRILNPNVLHEMDFGEEYRIMEIVAPTQVCGKPISESGLRQEYGANLIGYKRAGSFVFEVQPDHVPEPEDVLIVGISTANRKRLLELGS